MFSIQIIKLEVVGQTSAFHEIPTRKTNNAKVHHSYAYSAYMTKVKSFIDHCHVKKVFQQ